MFEQDYLDALEKIYAKGELTTRRNGSVYEFLNLTLVATELPLLTIRKINIDAVVDEFIWEYNGHSNIYELGHARGWWSPFADEFGEVPNAYGFYVSKQIPGLLKELKRNSSSRRLRLVVDSPETDGFPACQPYKTFTVNGIGMHMTVTSRSSDMLLGLPNDMLKDWLYLSVFALVAGVEPASLTYNIANAHIYLNQLPAYNQIIGHIPSNERPTLDVYEGINFEAPEHEDFTFTYDYHYPAIKIPYNV